MICLEIRKTGEERLFFPLHRISYNTPVGKLISSSFEMGIMEVMRHPAFFCITLKP